MDLLLLISILVSAFCLCVHQTSASRAPTSLLHSLQPPHTHTDTHTLHRDSLQPIHTLQQTDLDQQLADYLHSSYLKKATHAHTEVLPPEEERQPWSAHPAASAEQTHPQLQRGKRAASHPGAAGAARRLLSGRTRGRRSRRSVETSLTVRGEITKVLTVNTHPGMEQRLQCGRFCEFGACNILHIPGLFERRYCTCLPNYTGLQCHIRVVPHIQ